MTICGGIRVGVCRCGSGELEGVKGTDVYNVSVWLPGDGFDRGVCVGFEVSQVERDYWGLVGGWGGVGSVEEIGDA